MSDVSLLFNIIGRDRTGPALGSAGRGFDRLGDRAGKAFKYAKLGAAGAALAVGAFVVKGMTSLARIEKIGAQTDAVIKSTGSSAGVTRAEVDELAGAIEALTGIEAESITEGQNLLLTFSNIKNEAGKGNDVFDQTTQIMTDMAVAMGNDPKASALALGKALNDPIKGVTALSRVGVTFTADQKKMIGALTESGDVMGAQKVILKELNKEFAGSAEAFGGTTAGKMARFGHAVGTLQEQIAVLLMPAMEWLADFLVQKVIPAMERAGRALAPVGRAIRVFWNAARGGSEANEFSGKLRAVNNAGVKVSNWIRNDFMPVARKFGSFLKNTVGPALKKYFVDLWEDMQPTLRQAAKTFNNDVKPAIKQVAQAVQGAWPTIKKALAAWYKGFKRIREVLFKHVIPALIRFYGKYIREMIPKIITVIRTVARVIAKMVEFGRKVVNAGKKAYQFAQDVKAAIDDARAKVSEGIEKIITFFRELPGKAKDAMGDLKDDLVQLGRDFVQGFIDGIKSKVPDVTGAVGFLADKAKGALSGAKSLLFGSPSRLTMKYGRWFSEGFAIGIKDKSDDVLSRVQELLDKVKAKIAQVREFAKEIRSAFTESANLTSLDYSGESGTIASQLQKKADDAIAFAKGIAALRKAGLNDTSLRQIREGGPEGGLGAMQGLLNGGDIGAVNKLVRQINDAGKKLGEREAREKFGMGPDGPNRATIKAQGERKVRVEFDFGKGEDDLIRLLRKSVRVRGGGDVQVAFGTGGKGGR